MQHYTSLTASGFASKHEQRKPGKTQGHDRKPQLEGEQSEVQRPGEDRGRQPSPLGHDWMPLCVGKKRTRRQVQQINHPEHPNAQTVFPPRQRRARSSPAERSPAAPRRTSTSAAQAWPEDSAERNALGLPCGVGQRRRGVSRLGNPSAASGRPGASRPCLSDPSATGAQRPRCRPPGLWPAPSGQRPEESDPSTPSRAWHQPRRGQLHSH